MPFVEKNVEMDRRAAIEMVRVSNQRGVPVITVDGQVVVGFNQPRLMQLLAQAGQSKPRLGAAIADAASQARKRPGLPATGAFVGKVKAGSAAERAGLRAGDVITAIGGQAIAHADDVDRILPQMPRGRDVSLTYIRDGQTRDALLRL